MTTAGRWARHVSRETKNNEGFARKGCLALPTVVAPAPSASALTRPPRHVRRSAKTAMYYGLVPRACLYGSGEQEEQALRALKRRRELGQRGCKRTTVTPPEKQPPEVGPAPAHAPFLQICSRPVPYSASFARIAVAAHVRNCSTQFRPRTGMLQKRACEWRASYCRRIDAAAAQWLASLHQSVNFSRPRRAARLSIQSIQY
jgi:hypothetical protein